MLLFMFGYGIRSLKCFELEQCAVKLHVRKMCELGSTPSSSTRASGVTRQNKCVYACFRPVTIPFITPAVVKIGRKRTEGMPSKAETLAAESKAVTIAPEVNPDKPSSITLSKISVKAILSIHTRH